MGLLTVLLRLLPLAPGPFQQRYRPPVCGYTVSVIVLREQLATYQHLSQDCMKRLEIEDQI